MAENLSSLAPETMPAKSTMAAWAAEGTQTVNALRATMALCVQRSGRTETAMQGGLEQQMPPQAAVMILALPSSS